MIPFPLTEPYLRPVPLPTSHPTITSYRLRYFSIEANAILIENGLAYFGQATMLYIEANAFGPDFVWHLEILKNEWGLKVFAPIDWWNYVE